MVAYSLAPLLLTGFLGAMPQVASNEERARDAVRAHVSGEFARIHQVEERRHVGFSESHAVEIGLPKSPADLAIRLDGQPLQRADRERGVLARFLATPTGIRVRVKPLQTAHTLGFVSATELGRADTMLHANALQSAISGSDFEIPRLPEFGAAGRVERSLPRDSFPYLVPWSPDQEWDRIFGPMRVDVLANGTEVDFRLPLAAPAGDAVAKLYGSSQAPLLSQPVGEVHRRSMALFEGLFRRRGDHFFACRTHGIPGAETAHFAPTPNAAFDWQSMYAQNTALVLEEIAGKAQFWVLEDPVGQSDKLNGVAARGRVVFVARGFQRSAVIHATTRYNREEDGVRLSLPRPSDALSLESRRPSEAPTPWSRWAEPRVFVFGCGYEVSAEGEVSMRYQTDMYGADADPTDLALSAERLDRLLRVSKHEMVAVPDEEPIEYLK